MQFWGYKRSDGSVGVRNHVLILPACACASETCRIVASQVEGTKNVIINVGLFVFGTWNNGCSIITIVW